MKKNILYMLMVASSASFSSGALLYYAGGTFLADDGITIVTYTVTDGLYPGNITDPGLAGSNGIIHGVDDGTNATVDVSFTFSEVVTLTIDNHTVTGNSTAIFNGGENIFTADAGTWSYAQETAAVSYGTVASNVLTLDGPQLAVNNDWGSATISGIQTLSWSIPNNASNGEGFTFSATSSVPEPTSIALLGLGGLAVLARRRR